MNRREEVAVEKAARFVEVAKFYGWHGGIFRIDLLARWVGKGKK